VRVVARVGARAGQAPDAGAPGRPWGGAGGEAAGAGQAVPVAPQPVRLVPSRQHPRLDGGGSHGGGGGAAGLP